MKQGSVEVGAAVLLVGETEGGLKSQKSQVTDFASSVSHMKVITASKRLKGGPNEVWSNIPSSTFQPRARPLFQYRHYSEQQPLKLNPTAICETVSSKTNAFDLILNLLDCETVLKASGHVDKFTDLMVKDEKTGACYRADHLLKDFSKVKIKKERNLAEEKKELDHVMAVLDDLSAGELGWKIKEYGIVAPDTKNSLSDPYPFNLMFQTSIGPTGLSTRFQISPRQGFFRVREFILAEIEHFVDPEDKSHPNSLTWRFRVI